MKQFAAIVLVSLLFAAVAVSAHAVTIERASVTTSDGVRRYFIARPSRAKSGPRPLVILLHGHGGSADQVLGQDGNPSPLAAWLPIVEREGLILTALDGATGGDGRQGWNDCRKDAVGNPKTDDVLFVRSLIERMEREEGIDPSRVYVMGMSNGGMMAFRLALELDPPIAGFTAVCSSMAADSLCHGPQHPVSVLLIAGTADPLVPYDGGQVRFLGRQRGAVIGIEQAVAFWRKVNGIVEGPATQELVHLGGIQNPTRATRMLYGSVPGAAQVELVRIDGGGHIEPSLTQRYRPIYERLVGHQNHDFESAEEAWRFFSDKHAAR